MKISICASVNFSDRIKEVVEDLRRRGCEVEVPFYTQKIIDGKVDLEEYKRIKSKRGDVEFREDAGVDLIKRHFDNIKNTDAILVLNYDKNGLPGYIGGNTFLEMGFAHVLGKRIYVLNELPKMGYSDELLSMGAVVLNGDLSKIVKIERSSEMTLKGVADAANKIEHELGLTFDDVLHKVTQECGEFNDVVQKFRGRYSRSEASLEDVREELSHLILNLSSVCNRLGINPDEFPKLGKRNLDKFEGRKEEYKR